MFKNYDGWAWYAFIFGLALTTSTALTSIMATISLIWLAINFREWRTFVAERRRQPVFVAMTIFLAILALGVPVAFAHGYSPWEIVGKHTKFIVFFVLIGLLHKDERRQGAFLGFGFGMILSMLISVLAQVSGIQILHAVPGTGELAPFLNHTEHNVFLSLVTFGLATWLAARNVTGSKRWLGSLLVLLAFVDIMLLVRGRTGQIIFVILAMVFFFTIIRSRTKTALAAILFVTLVGASAFYGHSALNLGLKQARQDIGEYKQGDTDTSVGFRVNALKSTLALIRDTHPIIGNGTGAFEKSYADYFKSHPTLEPPFANPHDDYIFYWAENGIFGVLALIGIYLSMFYSALKERGLHGIWLAALALAWSVPGTANSVMLDHVSGYTFVFLLAALVAGPLPFNSRPTAPAAS